MINTRKNKKNTKFIPKISVIIVTRNRPQRLLGCLQKLNKNSFTNFELIIIDQSDTPIIDSKVKKYIKKFPQFRFEKSKQTGKSRGLNQAIAFSSAPLLAFTDDDCVPDRNWIKNIVENFDSHPEISGIFGKTIPYQSDKHQGFFCPSTFQNKNPKLHIITKPCKHWESIGFGNNMAFRKEIFQKIGNFREWLGPGSIGSNAEDGEIALRTLISGETLLYNPKMIICHNRWLTENEHQKQNLSYVCGEIACYGFFALSGNQLAKKIIKNNFKKIFYSDTKQIFNLFIHFKKQAFNSSYWWILEVFSQLRGMLVAYYFFLTLR